MERELNINTTMLSEREFINIKDLKQTLGTSQNTIYRICVKGDLKPYKFLGKNYWRCDDIKRYLIKKGMLITREVV